MRKGETIQTPHGPAKVVKFVMMLGFTSGVQFKVIETGEVINQFRKNVDAWQREATHNEQV